MSTSDAEAVKLTRADLRCYDAEVIKLIQEMQDAGWTAKLTSKSHVLLRAPDGHTTEMFGPRNSANRNQKNARAAFRRWLRAQGKAPDAR